MASKEEEIFKKLLAEIGQGMQNIIGGESSPVTKVPITEGGSMPPLDKLATEATGVKPAPKQETVYIGSGKPHAELKRDPVWQIADEVQKQVQERAAEKFQRAFKELPIDQKLTLLAEHVKDQEGEKSHALKVSLQRLVQLLGDEKPSRESLAEMKLILKTIPKSHDVDGVNQAVLLGVQEQLYHHVKDNMGSYELDVRQLNDVQKDIGFSGYGQTAPSHEDWKLYDHNDPSNVITGADPKAKNLRNFLEKSEKQHGLLREHVDYSAPQDIDKEIERLEKVYEGLLERIASEDPKIQIEPDQADNTFQKIQTRLRELGQAKRRAVLGERALIQGERFRVRPQDETGEAFFKELKSKIAQTHYGANRETAVRNFKDMFHFNPDSTAQQSPEYLAAKEQVNRGMRQEIRKLIAILEQDEAEVWRSKNAISGFEKELSDWLVMLQEFDPEEYARLNLEDEGRNVLHHIYKELQASESPFESKGLIGAMLRFRSMELQRVIAELPGVHRAYQLLDQRAMELIANDNNESGRHEIFKQIADLLDHDAKLGPLMAREGLDGRTAVELAYRTFRITGREAWWYNLYLYKNDCINYKYIDPKWHRGRLTPAHWEISLNPNTPLYWDFFRIIHGPQGIVAFFRMGSNLAGQESLVKWKTPGGYFGLPLHEHQANLILAEGPGADAFAVWLKNGGNLGLYDWYSRRHGFYIREAVENGWADKEFIALLERFGENGIAHEDRAQAFGLLAKAREWHDEFAINISSLSPEEKDVHLLKREFMKQEMWLKFSEYNDTPIVFAGGKINGKDNRKWQSGQGVTSEVAIKKIRETKNMIGGHRQDLRDELDTLERGYVDIERRAKELTDRLEGDFEREYEYKSKHGLDRRKYLPTMANYDIRVLPYWRLNRRAEVVRGNWRDSRSASALFGDLTKFFSEPTPANLLAIQKEKYTSYDEYGRFQAEVMSPLVMAFKDTQQARLFGTNPLENSPIRALHDLFASKWSVARGMKSLSREDYIATLRALMYRGEISRDQFNALRGGWWQRFIDFGLENFDPAGLWILVASILQEQAKEAAKESQKE